MASIKGSSHITFREKTNIFQNVLAVRTHLCMSEGAMTIWILDTNMVYISLELADGCPPSYSLTVLVVSSLCLFTSFH